MWLNTVKTKKKKKMFNLYPHAVHSDHSTSIHHFFHSTQFKRPFILHVTMKTSFLTEIWIAH